MNNRNNELVQDTLPSPDASITATSPDALARLIVQDRFSRGEIVDGEVLRLFGIAEVQV